MRLHPWFFVPALAVVLIGCDRSGPPAPETSPAPIPAAPAPAAAATAPATNASAAELQRLLGRWERTEGGYVIEIKEILPGGKLSAAYFNPRAINVSQAEATKDAGAVKVFLELRDQNYPGATYKLTYDPEHDRLAGEYFQPLLGETYQIMFVRQAPAAR